MEEKIEETNTDNLLRMGESMENKFWKSREENRENF